MEKEKEEQKTLRLLVVDDDPDIIELVKKELQGLYEIFPALSMVEALEVLDRNRVDIVLCDERLKGESGSELLTKIKAQYPDIVRILISGYTDPDAIVNAINKANVFKFIVKPWGEKLKTVLEEAAQYQLSQKKNQYRDSLTSLKSENTVLESLHAELKRSGRYRTTLSVLLISISNPKKESELHAFLVDRFLLKKIADILDLELRESDIAGRLSDNTFIILLTETDRFGAQTFFNRFMQSVDHFEKTVNKGLLPYKINSALHTVDETESLETDELIDLLYSKLE